MNPLAELLTQELQERKDRNKRYSLRAFARSIDLEPSALSKILKGQRIPSEKTFERIIKKLDVSLKDIRDVANWIELVNNPESNFACFSKELESKIKFYHVLMLEAFRIPRYANSTEKLRQEMKMDSATFRRALNDLETFQMLSYDKESDRVKIKQENNSTFHLGLTSEGLRGLQKQFLIMAMRALENVPTQNRCNSTLTVAISSEKLPDYIEQVAKFRRKIKRLAEKSGSGADAVYNFTFAVYPVVPLDQDETDSLIEV